ncbi:hypothetical protein K469DRAFT_692627 [Zopfia rhizophila CBS 207.26]|uniref:Uncharacterized protein n=1 Tax=Zopfia rhizophila CBS 207.26 TaxID=1314779 RepID=A0A6A6DS67_9PEZI|nr:hypothetical protein K469DRAFT_692627 [Zopfia rhizophila CBS 207.26]
MATVNGTADRRPAIQWCLIYFQEQFPCWESKKTFRRPEDQPIFEKDGKIFVLTSVSWSLGSFNAYLTQDKIFVPHGHFGLLGDHVLSPEIVDDEGNFKGVTETTDPGLFHGILGCSPGNFGVLMHFPIEVHRDSDHKGSRGLKALYGYDPETVKRLVDILVEMLDKEKFSHNYNLYISMLSSSFKLLDL